VTRWPLWRRLLGWSSPCPRWPCCTRPATASDGERREAARLANRYSLATLRAALELAEERLSR
jgi:hypothetical protein